MVKFVVLFDPSIDRTKERLLFLAFFQYVDKSNVYEILTSGRRRVIQQIGSITAFPSSTVLIRKSSDMKEFQPFLVSSNRAKSWKQIYLLFLRNEELFQGKKLYSVCKLTKGYHHAKEERI